MKKKKDFTIQLSQKATFSISIKAESIEDAMRIARNHADVSNQKSPLKPARPWTVDFTDDAEITGIFG